MNKEEKTNDPQITPKFVFGIRTDISRSIQFFSVDKCAYLAGNYIIICSVKEKNQFFIPAPQEFGEITSFAVDENKENIQVAIGQQSIDQKANLSVFRYISKGNSNFSISQQNLELLKVSKFPQMGIDNYEYIISISVNVLKGIVLVLTGPKSSRLFIYQNDARGPTSKFLFCFDMTSLSSYKEVIINPFDPNYFALFGDGVFSIIHIKDYDKKVITAKLEVDSRSSQFQDFSNYLFSFVNMTWISNTRLAFINTNCDVFVIDYVKKFDNPIKKVIKGGNIFDSESKGKAVFMKNKNLYVCREDGFIIKLEDRQMTEKMIIYEKPTGLPKMVYNLPRMDVHTLSINPSNNQFNAILISSHTNQLYYVDITNDSSISDGNNYKHFLSPFHQEEIICLDVAKLKQLVVTVSKDKTIRIWNYVNLQNEISSDILEEEPRSVTFHPNGLHIAALFKEKVRLYHILEKSMVVYKEITFYEPTMIKFSNFGNLFAVVYRNNFQIYNFFTSESITSSKILSEGLIPHTDEIKNFSWDKDDTGFATCGQDGKAYYWDLFGKEHLLINFYQKDFKLCGVDIHTEEDYSKKLYLLDENYLLEVNPPSKDKEDFSQNNQNVIKDLQIPKGMKFNNLFYDQESKIIFLTSIKQHNSSVYIMQYPFDGKRILSFQANSQGVSTIKTTFDLNHLFTGGNDNCLFFFTLQNVLKTDRRDDTLESSDLILLRKEDLDKEATELRNRLNLIDMEIKKEKERFEDETNRLEKEFKDEKFSVSKEIEKYSNSKKEYELKFKTQIEEFESELKFMYEDHMTKMLELKTEQDKIVEGKEKDKKKEEENKNNEASRNNSQKTLLRKGYDEEVKNLMENYTKKIKNLNEDIKKLEEENYELNQILDKDKSEKMESNDAQISFKRLELEQLKKTYEKVKIDHHRLEEKLKNEIKEIKDNIRGAETKKNGDRNELIAFQAENTKLFKQITDMQNDKKEKEDTILDKNNIRNELEKENQELEKFKFVLNYKIKELKHDKDPEERKLQMLEKQAKDMEGEIKKFEFEQSRNIIELSKNHDTMKVKEKQISRTEKIIDKLKTYKRIFQESLYMSMKNAKNHKELKKELIKLKRAFLDKDFVEIVERPYENNYESQRQFLEDNITNYGKKINDTRRLFTQDHQKIMRENKKLLTIVNELEKERHYIKIHPNEFHMNKTSILIRPKMAPKSELPFFHNNTQDKSNEIIVTKLKKQLFELEKDLHFIKEKRKKEKLKNYKEHSKTKREIKNNFL